MKYNLAEYTRVVKSQQLRLEDEGADKDAAGLSKMAAAGAKDIVYEEFETGRGYEGGGGQYKTGFTRDLGVAILRDTFKDKAVEDYFPSDVFLSHLKRAADAADVSPVQFPEEVFIPQLRNELDDGPWSEALSAAKPDPSFTEELGRSGVWFGANGGPETPLKKFMKRLVAGYNLLYGTELKVKDIGAYKNPGSSSLIFRVG